MKVFKLSHALISGGVSFQKFGARTIKDLAASAVVVTGIFKFPILALIVLDSTLLDRIVTIPSLHSGPPVTRAYPCLVTAAG